MIFQEYTNGERYISSHGGSETTPPQVPDKKERYSCPAASHRPPFNRRPVTRVRITIQIYPYVTELNLRTNILSLGKVIDFRVG